MDGSINLVQSQFRAPISMKIHHQLCFVEVARRPLSLHSLYFFAHKQTRYSLASLVNKIIHNFTNSLKWCGRHHH